MTKLLYQGHASMRLTANNGTVIYLDPYVGEGYDMPADLILVTHQHSDHNIIDKPMKKHDCRIIQNDQALVNGQYQHFDLDCIHIEAVPAYNKNHPVDKCVGYILGLDGLKLYFAGDTSTTEAMALFSQRNLDYAFLPTDGIYNMDAKEASACAKIIGATHSVPIHMHPGELFDRNVAEAFQAEGRLIIEAGQEINL